MTDIDTSVEAAARRIADRGQDALVERLRTAYSDAAAAHADLISLDDQQIEAMVQAAAENADGLQWRRALAGVAAEELGVSVTEALTHPAVARAQALLGAPSYEQSLAELIARPVPPPASQPIAGADTSNGSVPATAEPPTDVIPEPEPPAPEPEPEPEPEPPLPGPSLAVQQSVSAADSELPATEEHQSLTSAEPEAEAGPEALAEPAAQSPDELETVRADDVVLELLPEPDPIEYETQAYDIEATFTEEEAPPAEFEPEPFSASALAEAEQYPEASEEEEMPPTSAMALEDVPQELDLVIPAIHQGGVANLPTKREGLSVRLSAHGLDILQGEGDIIGRLIWDEIETLEVPHHRSRRRRHEQRARLVVRTPHGDASFDVPGISADDLRDRVEPIVAVYGRH
jgi:hypothetical protein